jgi:hypothetical protein
MEIKTKTREEKTMNKPINLDEVNNRIKELKKEIWRAVQFERVLHIKVRELNAWRGELGYLRYVVKGNKVHMQ